MWFFDRNISLKSSGIFQGFTDWHSHLLPGVDDGVQTIEESLQILSLYESLGVKEVWFTPHIMEDIPNATSTLKCKFVELKNFYKGDIELHLAAEYMLDHLFEERLRNNDLLPLCKDKNHLLVETSYFNPPMGLNNILLRIKDNGYIPVFSHPERYIYMSKNDYRQLKDIGIKFQLNLFSLVGSYGNSIKEKAKWLLKHKLYDLVGSDTHNINHLKKMLNYQLTNKTTTLLTKNIQKQI